MCYCVQAELNGYRNPAEWLFAGQLHLADATERLQADLFGRDAAEFFANVTRPCDLRNAGASGCEALAKLRNALDAIEAGGDAEGWVLEVLYVACACRCAHATHAVVIGGSSVAACADLCRFCL